MSQLTVDQALQLALEHQRSNKLAEAEEIFRQILDVYPEQADALHLLGALYLQAKRPDLAEVRVKQALLVRPEPAFSLTLGLILQDTQRHTEALELYQNLVARQPDLVEGYVHMGVVLSVLGRFEEAAKAFQEAVRLAPNHVQAQGNLGIVLCHLQRYDEAIWVLRAAIARVPKAADFHAALAAALYGVGQLEAALAECKEATALNPKHAQAQNLLALIYRVTGHQKEALEPARLAAELMPDSTEVQVNYGESLRQNGQMDEAAAHFQKVIQRRHSSANLFNNLGNVYKDQGRLDEAIEQYRRALSITPDAAIFSNLLYTMHYHPGYSAADLYRELQRYDEVIGVPLRNEIRSHTADRDPHRRLRIGYISSEFRQHALGLNLIPLFANHDKSQFEIFVYSAVDKPDFYTFRFRQLADRWEDIHGKTDAQLAELVRRDQIDILIDLHQHMAGNRLPVYARKPAPVQIAFAGYPGSTGLKTIDFRLTDPYLEPPSAPPYPSSEIPLRLPHSFWCYHPSAEVPVSELPAKRNGYITFGNLNNFCKLNETTYELWAQIMNAVPKSRLILLAAEGSHRKTVHAYFKNRGISNDRISFVTRAGLTEYYKYYYRIDLGLDSFPCNGHTTGMDSWWMGVPVISKQDERLFGRATWSQANNLGLPELVGATGDEFVQIAIALANDLPRLATLRQGLRERMQASPLMDASSFAKGIEAAYRHAWQQWCAGRL